VQEKSGNVMFESAKIRLGSISGISLILIKLATLLRLRKFCGLKGSRKDFFTVASQSLLTKAAFAEISYVQLL